jgi:hypothetical protein
MKMPTLATWSTSLLRSDGGGDVVMVAVVDSGQVDNGGERGTTRTREHEND